MLAATLSPVAEVCGLIRSFQALASAAQALLEDASARERAGAAGRAVVQDNQGALERLLAGIARLLG